MRRKKIIFLFIFFILFSSLACAKFIFQDNTYKSVLRVCNASGQCELLYGSDVANRTSSISNICYVYEVQDDKLKIDTFNEITNNAKFYIVLILVFILILTIIIYLKRAK